VEERDNKVYWTVWIKWPGMSDPQEYKTLVDTGTQCTLMSSDYKEEEPISISGVAEGSQEQTVLDAEESLTGNDWQKHPIVTGPAALCILGIDCLRRGYFKDQKRTSRLWMQLLWRQRKNSCLPCPVPWRILPLWGLLGVEEQQVPVATTMLHQQQYHTS